MLRSADRGEHRDYLTLAEEMEERDPHYAAVLGVRKRAVSGLAPEVEAASDAAADVKIADAVREMVAGAQFPALVEDCLDALGKGFAAVEIVWRRGKTWTPARYEWRDPRWFRWDIEDGRTLRLLDEQDSYLGVPLEPAKWIVHTPRLRSGLPARAGLARLAAAAYLIKAYALTDWTAFAEVYGMPLRLGRYGKEATESDIETLIGAVANLGTDAAAVMPESMRVEFEQASSGAGSGAEVFRDLAQYVDSQISKAVLGQTMTTDDGSSRAQAQVHDAVRGDILASDARQLAATLDRDLVTPFVRLNFGAEVAAPRLMLPVAEPEDTAALTQALERLVPLGLPVQASVVRDRLGLPDPEEGAVLLAAPGSGGVLEPPPASVAAAAAAELRPEDMDEATDDALDDWAELMRPLAEPVKRLASDAENLDQVREGLVGLIGEVKTGGLAERLARGGFAARVRSRAEPPAKGAGGPIDPGLPPEEAIRALRAKGYVIGHDWRDVWAEEHMAAFTVAKVGELDLLADIRGAVDKALAEGTTLRDFQKGLQPLLEERGWWGRKKVTDPLTGEERIVQLGSPRRLQTIFRTNLRMAYATGRWDRIQRVKSRMPYLRYTAVMDDRTRPEHASWHGTILPVDDPWWETHAPPNGWNCRCRLIQLSATQMRRAGWKVSERPPVKMRDWPNKRTGERVAVPEGIDAGFAYNPGSAGVRRAEISRLFADRLEEAVEGSVAAAPGAGYIYEWDNRNRKRKRDKHGVDFAAMLYFEPGAEEPERWWHEKDEEWRWTEDGYINGEPHRAVYTARDGRLRIITLFPLDEEK